MATSLYTVTVSHPGFKTVTVENVKVDAGVPATVRVKLEVGALTETVEVQGGAEILQTQSATVTSVLVGRQLHELPFTSRNLTELIVTQPGSATPGVPRSTSVYGLPQSALNVTLDGINIQDNSNKSSDGFFNAIFPRADAIEEMSVTGAAAGADSNAEGAMQVKMVTRSGSNNWHGGVFEQHRNQSLNANAYFNNLNSQPAITWCSTSSAVWWAAPSGTTSFSSSPTWRRSNYRRPIPSPPERCSPRTRATESSLIAIRRAR